MTYEQLRAERRLKEGKAPLENYRAPSATDKVMRDIAAAEAMNQAVAAERMRAWQPGTLFR